jgi:hypothetical protein
MTAGEYSNLLTRCAQALYTGTTKPEAKAAAPHALVGLKAKIAGTSASALETLRYTTSTAVVAVMPARAHLVDAAFEAFISDVRARIDTI